MISEQERIENIAARIAVALIGRGDHIKHMHGGGWETVVETSVVVAHRIVTRSNDILGEEKEFVG